MQLRHKILYIILAKMPTIDLLKQSLNTYFHTQLIFRANLASLISSSRTSGGLLISVPSEKTQSLIKELDKQKCLSNNIIGKVANQKKSSLIEII